MFAVALEYEISGLAWVYMSTVLILTVFFRFSRLFSIRNLDLLLLLALSPTLFSVKRGGEPVGGYAALFVVTGLILIRLLVDPLLRKRPQFGQNLNAAGLGFLCISAFVLLAGTAIKRLDISSGISSSPPTGTVETTTLKRPVSSELSEPGTLDSPVHDVLSDWGESILHSYGPLGIALLSHLAVVLGLLAVSRNLFNNLHLGLAMATLYLLHPGTALDVSAAAHVLPAGLIVWAFALVRRPMVSGTLLGLACGTMFFPLFLLPIWLVFYGRRGGLQFGTALLVVTATLATTLVMMTPDPDSFLRKVIGTINFHLLQFESADHMQGFWTAENHVFRIPVIVAYFALLIILTIWPLRKTIEHLITASAIVIVGIQFWYPISGGTYLLWYYPLLLMVIFRPRLVHLSVSAASEEQGDAQPRPISEGQLTDSHSNSGARPRLNLF